LWLKGKQSLKFLLNDLCFDLYFKSKGLFGMLKIIFLGDVMGKPGREAVKKHLPQLIEQTQADFVIANGENAAGGKGITAAIAKELYDTGIHCLTMGNHTFDRKDIHDMLRMDRKIIVPANYIMQTDGKGYRVFNVGDKKIAVLNLLGQVFMPDKVNCPFQFSKDFQKENRLGTDYDAMVVDFHAEATGEKCIMGHLWDGKASLVVGTHTHIPTSDCRVQPKGTAYQTDAGMCGDYVSSLGLDLDCMLHKQFDTRKSTWKWDIASGEGSICGVYTEVDENGLASHVQSFQLGGSLTPKPLVLSKAKTQAA
tara:strand:+ start:8947 stop:9876 length:930 start_codon:yes stop_codon:yes gene_type:complete